MSSGKLTPRQQALASMLAMEAFREHFILTVVIIKVHHTHYPYWVKVFKYYDDPGTLFGTFGDVDKARARADAVRTALRNGAKIDVLIEDVSQKFVGPTADWYEIFHDYGKDINV